MTRLRTDLNARDKEGSTPLHATAQFSKSLAMTALLLGRGADATLRDNDNKLPFDYAKENEPLQATDVYGRLNDARF